LNPCILGHNPKPLPFDHHFVQSLVENPSSII
jgi:hypothetical protein